MIIAEIGLNHLGSIKLAEMYIQGIAETEVNGITFQIREQGYYANKKAHLELTLSEYKELSKLVRSYNMKFGLALANSSLVEILDPITDFYKIIRNDITDNILTDKLLSTNKPIIVSTGLSSDQDITTFMNRYPESKNIILNHTQLSYDVEDCNLLAIEKMRKRYRCPISYGSHCDNKNTLYMSLCYNPSMILFYVKLDKTGKFPDDKHSIVLNEVKELSNNLKNLPNALGTGKKIKMNNKLESQELTSEEKKNIDADSWDNILWG